MDVTIKYNGNFETKKVPPTKTLQHVVSMFGDEMNAGDLIFSIVDKEGRVKFLAKDDTFANINKCSTQNITLIVHHRTTTIGEIFDCYKADNGSESDCVFAHLQ